MYFWTDPTSKEYGSPFYLPNFLLSKSASFFPSMVRAYKQSPAIRGGLKGDFLIRGGKSVIPLIVNPPNRWGMWGVGVHVKIFYF